MEKTQKNALNKLSRWFTKIRFIKSQIKALEKFKDIPIICIAVVILKSQLIEFEIKQMITSLDIHLYYSNNSKIIKRKIRTPKDLEKLALGELISELREFKNEKLYDLIGNLLAFNTIRIKFIHYLLNSDTDINNLIKDSDKGLKLITIIIAQIEDLNKYLDINDPLKI